MKAEELMLGDWVMCFGVPHKIVGIRTDAFYPYIKTDISDTWYEEGMEDLAEPIPLTSEILEKNGFKEDFETNGIYWRPDCRKFCIVKELGTWYFAFRLIGEIFDKSAGYICISECNYVHKLQHKLKDLEIEKEIVL